MEDDRRAPLYGLIAVSAFAATLPLTRIGLAGFAPLPLTFARQLGAAVPAELWAYAATVVLTVHFARSTLTQETRP